jgi:threonine dehydrogenase-like Zn-dependent dehydrogenase
MTMKATVLHGPGDIRYEGVNDPKIIRPTDAIIEQVAEGYRRWISAARSRRC